MSFGEIATRKKAKLRLAISGTAGAGKTYTALLLAGLFGSKIGVIDSEKGSASKYAGEPGIPEFRVVELDEKNPQAYLEAIQLAAANGIDALVIDSYSHSWMAALEMVDKMGGNKFSNGWKVVSPLVTKLVEAILSYPGHIICTMRSKADYAVETINGKATPKKVGMATVARDGTDFEFDVMIDLTVEGGLTISKTRCSALTGQLFTRDDALKVGKIVKAWIEGGAEVSPRQKLADQIRFASSADALAALVKDIAALSEEDRLALRPVYVAKKEALEAVNS